MAEPQPSGVHEGASAPSAPPAAEASTVASAAAEAAALSSLDNKTLTEPTAAPKKEVDLKALSDAMKGLDAGSGGGGQKATATASQKGSEEPRNLIKVNAADVSLLAGQLDISKPKATELLRAHDADAVRAMRAWVSAPVS